MKFRALLKKKLRKIQQNFKSWSFFCQIRFPRRPQYDPQYRRREMYYSYGAVQECDRKPTAGVLFWEDGWRDWGGVFSSTQRASDVPHVYHLTCFVSTPFYSVLVSVSVFMALSTTFYSINPPDISPLSRSVLLVLFLLCWSFQLHISLWKSPSAVI